MNLDLLLVLFAVVMLLVLVAVVISEAVWRKKFMERVEKKGEGVVDVDPAFSPKEKETR